MNEEVGPADTKVVPAKRGGSRSWIATMLGMLQLAFLAPVRGRDREAGMTTAEYAVGTIAAAAFAAVLYQVVTGDSIVSALGTLISKALSSL